MAEGASGKPASGDVSRRRAGAALAAVCGFLITNAIGCSVCDAIMQRTHSSFVGICGPHGDDRWIAAELAVLGGGFVTSFLVAWLGWRTVLRRVR